MSTWYSAADDDEVERLVAAWTDAPIADLETLSMLLEVARDQVWSYDPDSEDDDLEPVLPPTTDVPVRLVLAQLRQATNLWNAGRVNSSGDVGMDSFTFTPRPLDKTIRGIIRPLRGTFDVG